MNISAEVALVDRQDVQGGEGSETPPTKETAVDDATLLWAPSVP